MTSGIFGDPGWHASRRMPRLLPYRDLRVARELIRRQGKIVRRWTIADAAGRIVDRAVTRAKVTALIGAVVLEWHAAEMGANADEDEPFRLLHPRLIGRRIAQLAQRHRARKFDLFWGAMADENWLARPFHGSGRSFRDIGDVDFRRGGGECRRVGTHLVDQRPGREPGPNRAHRAGRDEQNVPPGRFVRYGVCCHDVLDLRYLLVVIE